MTSAMSPALRASLPMLFSSVAKPGSQFAGLTLDQFAQLVERSPQIRTSFEAFVADQVPPPPPPPPAPPPPSWRPRPAPPGEGDG